MAGVKFGWCEVHWDHSRLEDREHRPGKADRHDSDAPYEASEVASDNYLGWDFY